MSGTGQNNQKAPTRLTPIAVDQPIAQDPDGKTSFPTPYFAQAFQRILSYLGQPSTSSSSGGTSGLTVSEQLNTLTTDVQALQASSGSATPSQSGLVSRISEIEVIIRNLLRYDRPPPTTIPASAIIKVTSRPPAPRAVPVIAQRTLVPGRPTPPDLTGAFILSWWGSG